MNKKQLNEILCINKIKNLTPEVYTEELHVSHPFFILSTLLFNKTEASMSEQYQLTQSELDILASLLYADSKEGSLTPTELKNSMFFTSGGMTKVLNKLENKEYIVRVESVEDKRSKSVKLTKLGESVAIKALKDVIEIEANYFSRLDKSEQKQLETLLYKILEEKE